jgi:pectate lyase
MSAGATATTGDGATANDASVAGATTSVAEATTTNASATSDAGQTTTSGGAGGTTGAGNVTTGTEATGAGTTDASSTSMGGATVSTTATVSNTTATASGCPVDLEGFATVSAESQDGTYGGRDGEAVTVTTQAELNQYATASEPYTIRVQGTITLSPKGTEIRVASDKTIIGVGASGEIAEGGFFLAQGVHNVIIRNLTIRDSFVEGDWAGDTQDFDAIQMDTAHHVWIDHCHLHHGGDGLIDSRMDTTYLTVSWSILSDHNKAFGIGWTDNVTAQMTIHHNWLRDLNQRNPAVDNVLRAHLYNNFMQRIDSYGNHARGATNMILENSVFEDVPDPHYADTGTLVATGNIYRNTSGQQESQGAAFFNPSDYYDYALHPASEVEALLADCAGPLAQLGL